MYVSLDQSAGGGPYLGGNVVGGAAEGGGGDPVQDALLTHAEVGQLTVALGVQQDVVQLQVPEEGPQRSRFTNTTLL